MKKTNEISWKPFNKKTSEFIVNAPKHEVAVAEGAIRSGKTIALCIIAQMYLETCEDRYHLITGSTIGNAKLNIGVSNGFGLEALFRGRCRWGKYKNNEALYVDTKTGEKVLIFAGGGKADSYKSILGNSYGMWFATEINQHYDSDDSRESFIKVALGRQIASNQPFTLWDLNPEYPMHKIYTDYIDKWKEEGLRGGYLYEHFTIEDNLSITPERKLRIISKYDKDSVWYKRDILGMRVRAEGLIYQQFADKPELYEYDVRDEEGNIKLPEGETVIGIDYGGTKSGQAYVAVRIASDYSQVIALKSRRVLEPLNDKQLLDRQLEFISDVMGQYKCKIDYIYPDNANPTHIRSLDNAVRELYPETVVRGCWKIKIMERVKGFNKMIAFNVFKYIKGECETLVEALCTAIYNPKKQEDERLDNGTSDIDTLDSFEYSWERDLRSIIDKMMEEI